MDMCFVYNVARFALIFSFVFAIIGDYIIAGLFFFLTFFILHISGDL